MLRIPTWILAAALGFSGAAFADEPTHLSCQVQYTSGSRGLQTMEVVFSQSQQKAQVGSTVVRANISDTQILFDLPGDDPTVVLHFNIDRLTGRISVAGKYEVLLNGECKLADVSNRRF
ncbi:MAG TPA: hypothetical protein VEC59_11290 [Steroidobacteraceae bacterium]|nr:hypothetical protein [Steroidobacteraceae bacterium]